MASEAFNQYSELLKQLDKWVAVGADDCAEADKIRDQMDAPWAALTEQERREIRTACPAPKPAAKEMQDMNEPELREHLNRQMRLIKEHQTPDTIGSMLIIFQKNGITQYGSTVDPETAPQALRELADRIERRQTVKR